MLRYILRRLALTVLTIVGITLVLFIIIYQLPGDPATMAAGPTATPDQVEALREKLGLNKPPHIQYLTYMKNLLRGDLGVSTFTRKPVVQELMIRLPASLELMLIAMPLNVLIAVPFGVFSAMRPGRFADLFSRLFAALGMGMPVFWVALMAQLVFYGRLGLLPFGGRLPLIATAPDRVTGLLLIDTLLARDLSLFKDALTHIIMPAVVLALPEVAVTSRVTRSSVLDVLMQDYVRTARAKGLPERVVIWTHVFKNAMLATLTIAGMQIGFMLGGALLVEGVFSWPGLGYLVYLSVYRRDFPVMMGVVLVQSILFVLSSMVVDILYSYVDPRITLS